MHLAAKMSHERLNSSSTLPTHHNQHIRRRVNFPSALRLVRYGVFAVFLLFVVGFLQRQNISPAVSRYLPSTVEEAKDSAFPSTENSNDGSGDGREPSLPDDTITVDTISQGSPPSVYPKFGKVTASFGDPDPPYENAIASHNIHNELHGYPHFILREHMLRGLWSKHGWLLTILGQELAKPADQRIQWLMWHDRDTVLMNPQIPLDVFVPPEPEFNHINLLVTNDRHGLNNGVFMVRVGQWAFKLFASALSIREYQPEIPLKYTEQSGMEEAIKRPWWASGIAYVPQRWLNGFPPEADLKRDHKAAHARPGSLLIHFASNRDSLRPERMAHWDEVARNRTAEWDRPVEKTGYLEEIAEYWDRVGKGESFERINRDIGGRVRGWMQ